MYTEIAMLLAVNSSTVLRIRKKSRILHGISCHFFLLLPLYFWGLDSENSSSLILIHNSNSGDYIPGYSFTVYKTSISSLYDFKTQIRSIHTAEKCEKEYKRKFQDDDIENEYIITKLLGD
jgi:hypothetical protein